MIDTNTLMTGDIVKYVVTGVPFRITAIISSYRVAGYAITDDTEHKFFELFPDELAPMPITPDFLEHNEWKLRGGFMIFDSDEPKCRFGWRNGSFILGYAAYPIPVHDVHHLQNIMRNAGLRDYANNIQMSTQE